MPNYFLVYCIGNSGGSWLQDVLNTHPAVKCWEEPRRKLNLTGDIQGQLLDYLQSYDGPKESIGYIKGFRDEIVAFVEDSGGRIIQLMRNPVQVIHGKRNRKDKATAWWGREPENEAEFFEGLVCQEARRYRKFMAQSYKYPLIRLEDLSHSILYKNGFIHQVLRYLTQVSWAPEESLAGDFRYIWPHYRRGLTFAEMFAPSYEKDYKAPFEKRVDPSAAEIWTHWELWQREIFRREFTAIMLNGRYELPWALQQ